MRKNYIQIEKDEFSDILYVAISLAFMFAIAYVRVNSTSSMFPLIFIFFLIFIVILLSGRIVFMKYISFRNGFEIKQYMTRFDRYGFRNFDRLSYYANKYDIKLKIPNPIKNKTSGKLPTPILSLIIYILTLGIFIFPSMWRYKTKIIPHKFLGTKQKLEQGIPYYMMPRGITHYRLSKAFFAGYLSYLIFAFFLKSMYNLFESEIIIWMIFIIFWIAFGTMIPLLGTEGYDYFAKAKIGWLCTLIILFLGLLSILIFKSILYIVFSTFISFCLIFVYMFWRQII